MSATDNLIERAVEYATEKHKGQKRKNTQGSDYIVHPLEVMGFIKKFGIHKPEILAAAVLHDVVEDTDATHEEIESKFGKEVSDLVREVSDDKSLPKVERKKFQVHSMKGKSMGARAIKIGDKWSNTRDLLTDSPRGWGLLQIQGYIVWSFEVCKNALSRGDLPECMNDAILNHFSSLGVDSMPRNTLEEYYESMK